MKRFTAFVLLCTIAAFTATAQKKLSKVQKYVEWDEKPMVHDVPPEYVMNRP